MVFHTRDSDRKKFDSSALLILSPIDARVDYKFVCFNFPLSCLFCKNMISFLSRYPICCAIPIHGVLKLLQLFKTTRLHYAARVNKDRLSSIFKNLY